MGALKKIDHFLDKFSMVFLYISSAALFIMAFLCFLDVIMRYFLNSPIKGAQEIIQVAMVIFVFFGLAQAARGGRFVRVPLFLDKMGKRLQAGFKAFASLVGIFVAVLFSRQLMINAIAHIPKLSMITPETGIPYWILYMVCSVGSIMLGLELIARFIRELFVVIGLSDKFSSQEASQMKETVDDTSVKEGDRS